MALGGGLAFKNHEFVLDSEFCVVCDMSFVVPAVARQLNVYIFSFELKNNFIKKGREMIILRLAIIVSLI